MVVRERSILHRCNVLLFMSAETFTGVMFGVSRALKSYINPSHGIATRLELSWAGGALRLAEAICFRPFRKLDACRAKRANMRAKQTPVWNFLKSTSVGTIRNVDENNTFGVLGLPRAPRHYEYSGLSAKSSQALRI